VASEVAVPAQVLQITPASTSDEIGKLQDAGLVNRTVMPDEDQGRALADVLEQDLGGSAGRRVNLGVESNTYGTGLADSFTRAWKAKQGLIGKRIGFGPKEKSYRPTAAELVSGDPDAWALFTFAPAYPELSRALLDTGRWSADRTYVTDALAQPDLPKLAGVEATEGLRGTAPGSPDDNPATAAFDKLYSSSPGPKPQTFDAQAFDAAILCYLSAVGAGKAEGPSMAKIVRRISGPPGRVYTWEQLPRAVEALAGGEDIDYEGASGPIDLNGAGDATAGAYDLYRYQDGKITVYDQVIVPKRAA
jgi:branched-chain amino acid transport system substrate-binding protein